MKRMVVKKLDIQEFRGIKSCKAPIELSHFTVLIGRNNAGKSTILEALSLLPEPKTQDYLTKKHKIDVLLGMHRKVPKGNKSLIYFYTGKAQIQYKFAKKDVRINLTDDDMEVFVGGHRSMAKDTLEKIFQVSAASLPHTVIFIPSNISVMTELNQRMSHLKDLIMKKGYHKSVAESLSECVDDEYSEIIFLDPISIRKVLPDNQIPLNIRDLGTGAEIAVKIMSLVEAVNPRLLLLDDFGSHFHPSLIETVLRWSKDKPWQTVMSTHSIDALYYLTEVEPADCSVLQLYKSKADVLDCKILTLDDLEDIFHANSDPRLLADALRL